MRKVVCQELKTLPSSPSIHMKIEKSAKSRSPLKGRWISVRWTQSEMVIALKEQAGKY